MATKPTVPSLTAPARFILPTGVTLHTGQTIPGDMEFVDPPVEIGQVLSASSTLRTDMQPHAMISRLLRAGLAWALVAVVASLWSFGAIQTWPWGALVGLFVSAPLGLTLFGVVLHNTNFRHTCTFVGTQGIALLHTKARRGHVCRKEVFLFADAVDLFALRTDTYMHGVYVRTDYAFTWKDETGKVVFKLAAVQNLKNKDMPDGLHFFVQAAEVVWSNLLLKVLAKEFEEHGFIQFKLSKDDLIRVGRGFLEFDFGHYPQRITVDEIGELTIRAGRFSVRHKDANWYSGKGKFTFDFGKMANAQLFVLALERLCGLKFG